MNAQQYQEKVAEIKLRLHRGDDYDKLKKEFQPILDDMNEKSRVIAKKHGVKFNKFSFANLIR